MANDIAPASAVTQAAGVGLADFLKLLTAQLNYQDPLKPVDNQEFIAQMAQFSALEQTRQLNEKIDLLLTTQSVLQSVGMIGKTVEFDAAAGAVAGQVTAISFTGGESRLSVLTASGVLQEGIGLSQIKTIR
jgi:flagellar basal-body rod modification protein FlgD